MTKRNLILTRVVVVICLFSNIAFAYKPSATFWESRSKQQSATLASLPVNSLPPSIMPQLSSLSSTVSSIRNLSKRHGISAQTNLPDEFFAHLNIRAVHPSKSNRTVVLVEDVHQNFEAQSHISKAIQSFGSAGGKRSVTVALEAASGGFVFDKFRKFPNQQIVAQVADSFLETGELTGPAHAGITFNKPENGSGLRFVGVDDSDSYRENVSAYKSSKEHQKAILRSLDSERREISRRKKKVFNARLLQFDAVVESHRVGSLPLGAYVATLSSFGAPVTLTMETFHNAYQMETLLDFEKIEAERRVVLESLVGKMNASDTQSLMDLSLAYQAGTVSFADYYQHLKSLCQKTGVNLARAPNFDNYIRYVLLSDGINVETLLQDILSAEKSVYAALAVTPEEKNLVSKSRRIYLTEGLANFTLTSDEWNEYKKNAFPSPNSYFQMGVPLLVRQRRMRRGTTRGG